VDCPISKLQGDALFEVVTGGNVVLLTSVYLGRSAQEHELACLDWQVDASLHVFYLDSAGDLQELYISHLNQQGVDITQASNWHASDWSSQVSAPKPAGPFAAFVFTSDPAQPEQVAYIDGNGHVQEFAVDYGVYKVTVSDLTQPTNAPLATPSQGIVGYEWAAGASQQIVYVDGHNHLQELSFIQGGAWKVTDLTTSASLFQ
jgi:hypothetical protein